MDQDYSAAIAGAIALDPAGKPTVAVAATEELFDLDLDQLIAKAEKVGKAWIIEIPVLGDVLTQLAKREGVTVFHVDEVPGSIFATTEAVAPGKSRLLVADGEIGTLAPEESASAEPIQTAKRISKIMKTAEERFVLGVVLEPETKDSQSDIYSHDEVRKAAHEYMEKAGNLGKQHSELANDKMKILETYIAPADFELDGEKVQKGTWLMGIRIINDELWGAVKKGDFTGFSIGGSAQRTPEAKS